MCKTKVLLKDLSFSDDLTVFSLNGLTTDLAVITVILGMLKRRVKTVIWNLCYYKFHLNNMIMLLVQKIQS